MGGTGAEGTEAAWRRRDDEGTELPRHLLLRAGQGDVDAFNRFYRLTVDDLARFVAGRVPAGDVEDLVAETYLRAFRGAGGFSDRGKPALAWLVTIARNQIAGHYAKQARSIPPAADARTVPSVEDRAEIKAEHEEIRDQLDELPARYREVLRLRYVDELPVAVCAAHLGMSEGAVRALTFRAVSALRRRHQPIGPGDESGDLE